MRASAQPSLIERWEALGRPFTHLPRWGAALVLALALAMALGAAAALAPSAASAPASRAETPAQAAAPARSASVRAKGDMALYSRVAARVAAGEDYYAAALAEHRASGYPTLPFVTIRPPTLAWAQAAIGPDGVRWLALALVAGTIAALGWRAVPLASIEERIIAAALLAAGGGAALSQLAGYDHDFIAGVLLSLALLAYRADRWWPSLLAAAAALAVRELAAPFVLLWLAFALAEHRRREVLALVALLALFAAGLGAHALAVDALRLPGDLASQGWNALAGYGVPLAGLAQLTGLRHLPPLLAAPLAVLPLLGWAGLGGRTGLFAMLWFIGLATGMALFARPANYYWIELALPAYAAGLAFAPRALAELFGRLTVRASKQI
jgi:MFS family permease